MQLVSFSDGQRREAVEVLHALMARASRGELVDMAACITDPAGKEYTVMTGRYRRDSGAMSRAGFLLQYMAMEAANDDA